MKFDEQDRFLKDEYLKLQDQYEDYDRRSLTIKGWVSAGAAAALVLGLKEQGALGPRVWLVVGGLAICFWYLEARWKSFQYALRPRIEALELYFRGGSEVAPAPLQIFSAWFAEKGLGSMLARFAGAAVQDFVILPYLPILVAAAFLYRG